MNDLPENGENTPKKSPKDNLMPPWQPGQSGNPAGRPKGSISFNSALRREIEREIKTSTGDKLVVIEALAKKLVNQALTEPEFNALREIVDRLEGKPKQSQEISGPDNGPIQIIIK